ncbi:unnamed protein product [Aspergillus oryzae]|nr:unnamed protein product [Aspergillus oryzae]
MVLAQPENKHVLKAFDLSGKVAAVTGRFCYMNSTTLNVRSVTYPVFLQVAPVVALIYNSSKTAETLATEVATKHNVKAAAYQADVANQEDIEKAIKQIATDFGKLDIIVANSGICSNIPAEDYTTEQWHNITKVNLDGAFYTAQAAARIFKEQGHGNVIFTASVSATLVNVPQKQAAVSEFMYEVVQG